MSGMREKANSLPCCGKWSHNGCAGVNSKNPKMFPSSECEGNIGEAVE